ncbi:MAG: helicase-associated domain-containing protein [Tepidisphaerales bacterium]
MPYYRTESDRPTTIRDVLLAHNNQHITPLVREFCEGKPPTRKEEMVARLLGLLEGDGLKATCAKLSEVQQLSLSEAVWSKTGHFDQQRFQAKYGRLPSDTSAAEQEPEVSSYGRRRRADLMDLLMPDGVIPPDLRTRMREFVPKPAAAKIKTVESPPDHVDIPVHIWNEKTKNYTKGTEPEAMVRRDMERAALHDLRAVLRLVDAGKVPITDKNRWPTPSALKQIAQVLDGGDFYLDEDPGSDKGKKSWEIEEKPGPMRAFAWPLLLQAGKLAQMRGPRLELTKAGHAALTAPPHETLRTLWDDWASSDLLDELRRINVIRGQTGKGQRHLTNPVERREAVADALQKCPVGRWIEVDEFSRYMRAAGHEFEVTDDDWTLYIGEQQYGNLADSGCNDWDILQLRYMLCLLMEYAATLGMIDIAFTHPEGARDDYGGLWGADDFDFFSRYDGLQHIRLNALGAFCLGLSETYTAPPLDVRKILDVLPNLDVVASGPLSPADRLLLDAFAEKTGDHVWRLDRDHILCSVAEGRQVQEVVAFLEASSGGPLPQPVARFFTDAESRAVALSDLGPSRLIRCADGALAALIANDTAAGKACSLVGNDTLVVPSKDEASFHRAVRRLGYVMSKHSRGG